MTAEVCPDCGRPYAPNYPAWQCSDTTCGMSPEWNEDGENHDDCINECLYATKKYLREQLAAQTEKAARAEKESAAACGRMRAQKSRLRASLAAAHACVEAADRIVSYPNLSLRSAVGTIIHDAWLSARAEYERVTKGEGER